MAPSLGELDVHQPALPPGSRSIERTIYVDAVAKTAIPITHYRIPAKQQPAATPRLVAKRKPASTVSGEQSDRQLSAGASRHTGR
jgi:hypothetical protein